MRTYQLTCEMLVPKPIEAVYEIFENPYNLKKITPPWLSFAVTSQQKVVMRKGAEIDYRFRWFIVPMKWRTLITAYNPPHDFVDEQMKGPYVLWRHRHTFEQTPEGTLVKDTVDYILPLGPLGALAHWIMIEAQLKMIFTYRQKTLNELWGGEAKITLPSVRVLPAPEARAALAAAVTAR